MVSDSFNECPFQDEWYFYNNKWLSGFMEYPIN